MKARVDQSVRQRLRNGSTAIAEYVPVRVVRDVSAEGCRIPKDTTGTVVQVYDEGKACAVEIVDLPGEPDVVTLRATVLEPVH